MRCSASTLLAAAENAAVEGVVAPPPLPRVGEHRDRCTGHVGVNATYCRLDVDVSKTPNSKLRYSRYPDRTWWQSPQTLYGTMRPWAPRDRHAEVSHSHPSGGHEQRSVTAAVDEGTAGVGADIDALSTLAAALLVPAEYCRRCFFALCGVAAVLGPRSSRQYVLICGTRNWEGAKRPSVVRHGSYVWNWE